MLLLEFQNRGHPEPHGRPVAVPPHPCTPVDTHHLRKQAQKPRDRSTAPEPEKMLLAPPVIQLQRASGLHCPESLPLLGNFPNIEGSVIGAPKWWNFWQRVRLK